MQRECKQLTEISPVRRTMILVTLLAAAFLTSMSTNVTGMMIPNFTAYFGISPDLAQWLTSGAALVAGITMPVTSFIIKKVSDKVYFIFSMTALTGGSLAAFLSDNFPMLLVSRLVQALGCGMLLPYIQVVLLRLYPKERHGSIMGAYAMSSMVSSAAAPAYAGFVLDNYGWRGVFVSLCAAGTMVLFPGIFLVKNLTDKETAILQYTHVLLSAAGFTAFLIGINHISDGLFLLKSGGLTLVGITLLVVFTALQLKSESPMLNLHVFRHPPFRTAVLLNLCMYLITMGNAVILPVFAKDIRGFSNTAFGMTALVGSAISVFVSLYAGKQYDKIGIQQVLRIGVGLFASFTVTGVFFSEKSSIAYIAVVYTLQSAALAVLNSPATAMALSNLEGQERIDGSAIYNTMRQIASSLGSTIAVLIYTMLGSDISAIHGVFWYYGFITLVIFCIGLTALHNHKNAESS